MYTFGPVPSRRLGQSLGVNNIPAKICTYACVYCQIGRTLRLQVRRQNFFPPDELVEEVVTRVGEVPEAGERVDAVTFVPDGEPTLDARLGEELRALDSLAVRRAVITNGSLLWDPAVRDALAEADWVSVKVDAVREDVWHRVDRPHGKLLFDQVLEGVRAFAQHYRGTLVTETMLVRGLNDSTEHLEEVANFLTQLGPQTAYLAVPTRPPAEDWVQPPTEERLNTAYQIFLEHGLNAELLVGFEGTEFASTGDARHDLLSITAVHPMRWDQVVDLLEKENASPEIVDELVEQGLLRRVAYRGQTFVLRRFARS